MNSSAFEHSIYILSMFRHFAHNISLIMVYILHHIAPCICAFEHSKFFISVTQSCSV